LLERFGLGFGEQLTAWYIKFEFGELVGLVFDILQLQVTFAIDNTVKKLVQFIDLLLDESDEFPVCIKSDRLHSDIHVSSFFKPLDGLVYKSILVFRPNC